MNSPASKQKAGSEKVACIIPARYGSTRLPGKPLIEIGGVPLIVMVYRRVEHSRAFDEVVVATDDIRILNAVQEAGGKAVMTSVRHASGTDRIFEASQKLSCGFVVNVQGDEPLIPEQLLKDFAKEVRKIDDNSLITCVTHATIDERDNPNVVKAVLSVGNNALYFSRSPVPYYRDGGKQHCFKHIGMYGFTVNGIGRFCSLPRGKLEKAESLEQLRALEHGMRIRCLIRPSFRSLGIDTPQDVEELRRLIGKKK
jgi:3-deoxy-manno-octulosonate cytidylyltransferase (CMP-KDO synthetase)